MTHRLSGVSPRRFVVLAGTLIALCLAGLAFTSASASASPYCGGWLGAYGQCWGAERNLSGVTGYGDQHSVCVGIGAISGRCSGGPGAQVSYYWGSVIYAQPRIENNAAGNNFVHGETF